MVSIIEDICNKLADMPGQDLPVYPFLFPMDVVNCVAIFPAGSGLSSIPGTGPLYYAKDGSKPGAIDTPNIQIQCRYTDPANAFVRCRAIQEWIDFNPPTGYLILKSSRSQPDNLTSPEDLAMVGGPAYRFSCNYECAKVRT
jgi:hypothetical protein